MPSYERLKIYSNKKTAVITRSPVFGTFGHFGGSLWGASCRGHFGGTLSAVTLTAVSLAAVTLAAVTPAAVTFPAVTAAAVTAVATTNC